MSSKYKLIKPITARYYKKKGTKAKVPKKIKAYVKKAVNAGVEMNYIDEADDFKNLVANTAQFKQMNPVVQGDEVQNRAGNEIRMQKLQLKWRVYCTYDGTNYYGTSPFSYRLMLVEDKQCNGAIFAITDLLDFANQNSMRNNETRKRFKVYFDQVYMHDPNSCPITTNGDIIYFTEHKKTINLKNSKVEFNGNAGTVADITKNSLYLVCISSCNDADANHRLGIVSYNTRLFFHD